MKYLKLMPFLKQSNILQFALTRGKRSKRQFQCDQFTSSTELIKPNYLVTPPQIKKV